MSPDTRLQQILACPRCDQPLAVENEDLRCPGCATRFPHLDDVPFLFADPPTALGEWRERLNLAVRKLGHEANVARDALQDTSLSALTRERLEKLRTAAQTHAEELRVVLAPLRMAKLEAGYETYLALRTRLPTDQGLTTYYSNMHRDWCWGDEENAISLQLVAAALDDRSPGKLLTLGAGAGRLAYDLHMSLGATLGVALDFNPLLVLCAAKLVTGAAIDLHEFPFAPRTLDDLAVARTLRAPAPVRDGFYFVLGSALRPPFRFGAFDTLVTPWLVDILPEPLSVQAARWNALLKPGGRWVWFGSHAFRAASPQDNPSLAESCEIIEAAGFSTPDVREEEIPYMASPASRHSRRERVVVIRADKMRDVPRPPRHQALPDWLVTGKEPVPANESFRVQAMSTRIYAFIMAMIDGKRSIADMARLLEEQKLMPRAEAETAVRNFLIRMHEDSQRYSGL